MLLAIGLFVAGLGAVATASLAAVDHSETIGAGESCATHCLEAAELPVFVSPAAVVALAGTPTATRAASTAFQAWLPKYTGLVASYARPSPNLVKLFAHYFE